MASAVFKAFSADSTIFAVLDSHLFISDSVHSLMLDDMSIIIFWWVGASLNDVGFR